MSRRVSPPPSTPPPRAGPPPRSTRAFPPSGRPASTSKGAGPGSTKSRRITTPSSVPSPACPASSSSRDSRATASCTRRRRAAPRPRCSSGAGASTSTSPRCPSSGSPAAKPFTRRWSSERVRSAAGSSSPAIIPGLIMETDFTPDAWKRGRDKAERFQAATFRIAEAAAATESLQDLFTRIHSIVGGLMEAANFYIALHDPSRDVLGFPYFVDEVDEPFPPKPLGKGLTEYVFRTGRPLLASPDVFEELVASGEVERIGSDSVDWLGVPLRGREQTIGVLAVQSYSGTVRYTEEDRDLLVFVSSLIAQAIERKRSEEALRESELKLRAIVAALPDLILVLDREGRYLEIHSNRAEILVQPREALLGHTIPDFLPAPVATLWLEKIAACLLTGATQALEYALEVQAGPRVFEARMVPYTPSAVMTVIRDVTDASRAAAALDQIGRAHV